MEEFLKNLYDRVAVLGLDCTSKGKYFRIIKLKFN